MHRALFQTQTTPQTSSRTVDVVASTPAPDSYGRIVVQDWDLSRFEANPVVLWNHGMSGGLFGGGSDDSTLPIGFATNVRVEDGALKATLNFVDEKANPIAEKVYQGFLQGSLRAVSVGWDAEEATYDEASDTLTLTQNKLIEISAVALPANPEAVRQAAALFNDLRGMKPMKSTVIKALDLAASATEAEVTDRIASLTGIESQLHDVLSLIGATSVAEAQGIVAALKSSSERVSTLQEQVAGLLKEKSDAEFASVIAEARKAGKFVASNEAGLVAAAKGDVETLKAIVAHLIPVVNMAHAVTPQVSTIVLTAAEEAKCKANGWDPQRYAEMKRNISRAASVAQEGTEE